MLKKIIWKSFLSFFLIWQSLFFGQSRADSSSFLKFRFLQGNQSKDPLDASYYWHGNIPQTVVINGNGDILLDEEKFPFEKPPIRVKKPKVIFWLVISLEFKYIFILST